MYSKFNVHGMHCIACKKLIEEDLSDMSGVLKVEVDLPHNSAKVEYDESLITAETLIEKINSLGYQTEVTK